MTIALAAAITVAACIPEPSNTATPSGPRKTRQVVLQDGQPVYPRTATYWLDQDKLPPVEELARYDLVVMDSEWPNRVGREFFTALRQRNPRIVLLAYVNLIDYPERLGSPGYYADRYDLWQFSDSTTSSFPRQWLARTADGDSVSEWPNSLMANLADSAPRVGGELYCEYAARWVNRKVWSTGLWDGVFLDVWGDRIYTATHDSWDVDGNGSDEPDSAIYGPDGPWERGVTRAEQVMRAEMPTAILVGNGDRTLRDQLLNGPAFESFADPRGDRDPFGDINRYLQISVGTAHRNPATTLTINVRRATAGSAQEYRNARFFLTATLLQDGYWAPMGQNYGELAYYDELDGAGLGTGYLGRAMVADPTLDQIAAPYSDGIGTVAPGVVRRDFEHGIVLNNMGSEPSTVDLDGTFQKLRGQQDPRVNDGQQVTSVTLQGHDGLVLLHVPQAPTTSPAGPATPG